MPGPADRATPIRRGVARSSFLALLLLAAAIACARAPATPVRAGSPPLPPRVRLPVRGGAQVHNLSCESRSAVDLLAAYGLRVAEDAFLAALPRSDDPERGFVGDPDGPSGGLPPAPYGVHEEPVAAVLRGFGLPAEGVRAPDRRWLARTLASRRPVIVWATYTLDAPRAVALQAADGHPFEAVRGEHTFLAVGYGAGDVLLWDPATGACKAVPWEGFDRSWAVLGRRAVVPHEPLAPTR